MNHTAICFIDILVQPRLHPHNINVCVTLTNGKIIICVVVRLCSKTFQSQTWSQRFALSVFDSKAHFSIYLWIQKSFGNKRRQRFGVYFLRALQEKSDKGPASLKSLITLIFLQRATESMAGLNGRERERERSLFVLFFNLFGGWTRR